MEGPTLEVLPRKDSPPHGRSLRVQGVGAVALRARETAQPGLQPVPGL